MTHGRGVCPGLYANRAAGRRRVQPRQWGAPAVRVRAWARRSVLLLLFGDRIDDRRDNADAVYGEAAEFGVAADGGLVGGDVDAVDLVFGNVAVDPLDVRSEGSEHVAGLLTDRLQLAWREAAGSSDIPLDQEFGHGAIVRGMAGGRHGEFRREYQRPGWRTGLTGR